MVPDTTSPLLRAKKDRLDLLFLPDESPEQERLCIIPYVTFFLLSSDELRRRFRRTEPSSSTLEHICRSTVSLRFFPLSLPSFSDARSPVPVARPKNLAADELGAVAMVAFTCGRAPHRAPGVPSGPTRASAADAAAHAAAGSLRRSRRQP